MEINPFHIFLFLTSPSALQLSHYIITRSLHFLLNLYFTPCRKNYIKFLSLPTRHFHTHSLPEPRLQHTESTTFTHHIPAITFPKYRFLRVPIYQAHWTRESSAALRLKITLMTAGKYCYSYVHEVVKQWRLHSHAHVTLKVKNKPK